ncbi:MAG: amino acid ABC transporter permease [Alphaproteobacteria bacterium]|nr:amino acid ABC transporter permease [Alphaproteobacteria bacterium]
MTTTAEARETSKVSFWNDPKVRSIAVQTILVLALVWAGYEIVVNTVSNLNKLGKEFGFAFLSRTAGFDIIQSLIEYSSSSNYGRAILVGFYNTLLVSVLSIIAATVIGFIMGVMRLSKNWLLARIGTLYVEIFRNVPLLLWIFIFYSAVLQPLPGPKQALNLFDSFFLSNRGFMMPKPIFGEGAWLALAGLIAGVILSWVLARWSKARQMATGETFPVLWTALALIIGLPVLGLIVMGFPLTWEYPELKGFNFAGGIDVIPELMALLLALSIYTGTYVAEAVRAGILAVSHGQTEASYALGLRPGKALRLVVIPQAMRVIIPPMASTYLSLTKNSSLAVAIGYPDLVSTGGIVLNQSGQAIEIVGIWMVVYLSLSLLTSLFMNWFNARMKLVER